MDNLIRVAILDDHQSIIDGYLHRLSRSQTIIIVDYACSGDYLHEMLDRHQVDVLLLDIHVPESAEVKEEYPVISQIAPLLDQHPKLHILPISMNHQPTLIEAVIDAGASGYILKDDTEAIQSLIEIIETIAGSGFYLSPKAAARLSRKIPGNGVPSPRQLEVLCLCAAHPEATSEDLAQQLGIAPSTFRQLLSRAYYHLGVNNRAEAILKARQMGLFELLDTVGE